MNTVVEARIKDFLVNRLKLNPVETGTILTEIDSLARVAGFELDDRFASAGLGAGPEARVASRIVDYALLGGGTETDELAIRQEIQTWLRTKKPKGLWA